MRPGRGGCDCIKFAFNLRAHPKISTKCRLITDGGDRSRRSKRSRWRCPERSTIRGSASRPLIETPRDNGPYANGLRLLFHALLPPPGTALRCSFFFSSLPRSSRLLINDSGFGPRHLYCAVSLSLSTIAANCEFVPC